MAFRRALNLVLQDNYEKPKLLLPGNRRHDQNLWA
jgi:hypothetical protein